MNMPREKEYFRKSYTPSAVNVIARVLSVCIAAFIAEGPLCEGESRKQRRREGRKVQEYLRALSKSVRDKSAHVGDFIDEEEINKHWFEHTIHLRGF